MKRIFFLLFIIISTTIPLAAQVTTSTLSGRIIEEDTSLPIAGVTILAVHEPTGTRSYTMSGDNGSYSLTGLQSGGPYTVSFSMLGYAQDSFSSLSLALGEVTRLDAVLSPVQLDAAVITQMASKLRLTRTGSSKNITSGQIDAMPTISRSITDYIRLSPFANDMSLAGGDGRMTNFTVDGANFNNNYGLNSKLPGGGNPISIEAIDEIQLVISAYDVRQTGFIGGGINTVTKSGSNTFKGTAYAYYAKRPTSNWIIGATAGGPIIKNKLFFFLNYEQENKPQNVISYRARLDNETPGGNISRTKLSDMNRVSEFLKSFYGYNPGNATDFPSDNRNRKALLRLDWNINNAHRLTTRYNYTFDKVWNAPNDNSCDTGYRLTNTKRVGPQSMAFSGNMYGYNCEVHSAVLDLNSRFSDHFSNQLLATYTDNHEYRSFPLDQRFPHVDIMMEGALEPYISLGDELFSRYTDFTNTVANIRDDVTLSLGAHTLMAGLAFEYQHVSNCYMRNGGLYYRYASVDDFINRAAPESFALTYGFDGVEQPDDHISYKQLSFYLQDEWNVTPHLKVSGGLRLDEVLFNTSDFQRNDAVYELTFRDGLKIDTGRCPASHLSLSPRLGFSWDALHDGSLTIRGGSGLFLGRLPLVYFMNVPSYANLKKNSVQFKTSYSNGLATGHDARLDQFAGTGLLTTKEEVINKFGLPTSIGKHSVPYQIIGVDPDFKLPQSWKTTLAVDYKVPVSFPFTVSAEGIFNKTVNGACVENPNLDFSDSGNWERFTGADNRLIYPASKAQVNAGKNVAYLTNTNSGYGVNAQFLVNMTPVKNLDLYAAYAFTDFREITGFPGTDLYSVFTNVPQVDGPGLAKLQRTQFVIPHKVTASVNYFIPWTVFNGDGLHLGLFYTAYSPAGYSYVYTNDMNGDGVANDLMYIPRNDSEIRFVDYNQGGVTASADEQRAAFWAFVNQDSYLRSHKGQYAKANAARAPWVHRLDLRIAEDFSFRVGRSKHNFQLSMTILNFMNIFDSKFGMEQVNSACNGSKILNYAGRDADGHPTFTMYHVSGKMPTKTFEHLISKDQAWRIQIGLKYFFN